MTSPRSASPADGISNINDMLDSIEKKDPNLPVILCTTPPSANPKAPVKQDQRLAYNDGIRKLAEAHKNVTLAATSTTPWPTTMAPPSWKNFGPDHLHPVRAGV